MGNRILRDKTCTLLAFWGYSWQKMLLKKKKKRKEKNNPAPFTFEQTLAEPALIHNFGKVKTPLPPPQHTRTHRWGGGPHSLQVKYDKRFIRSICLPASSPSILGIPDFHSQPSRHNKNFSHVSCSACWFSLKTVILNPRVQMEDSANPRFTLCRCNPWMGFPCLQ